MFNEGNQIHNLMPSSGSGTVINYGSGSDFLTSYGSGYGSGSTSQKVTVPTVPVPQHWEKTPHSPPPPFPLLAFHPESNSTAEVLHEDLSLLDLCGEDLTFLPLSPYLPLILSLMARRKFSIWTSVFLITVEKISLSSPFPLTCL